LSTWYTSDDLFSLKNIFAFDKIDSAVVEKNKLSDDLSLFVNFDSFLSFNIASMA
jgi:hypothetical protein